MFCFCAINASMVKSRQLVSSNIVSRLCINGVITSSKQLLESVKCYSQKSLESSVVQLCLHQIRYSSVTSRVLQPFLNPLPSLRCTSQSASTTSSNTNLSNQCGSCHYKLNDFCPLFTRDSIHDICVSYSAYATPSTPIPSVCTSHACIVSKRLNVSSKFFHCLIGPSF